MNKTLVRTLGISTATATLALFAFAYAAQAQQPTAKKVTQPPCSSYATKTACLAHTNCKWVAAGASPHCRPNPPRLPVPIDKSPPKQ